MSIDEIKSDIYKKLGFEIKSDNIKNEIQEHLINAPFFRLNIWEMATGVGKTRPALFKIGSKKTLIVISQILHEQNWKDEAIKWNIDITNCTFVCYNSLYKHIDIFYDLIIFDEFHRWSDMWQDILPQIQFGELLGLSGTLSSDTKKKLYGIGAGKPKFYTILTEQAVEWGLLPEPKINIIRLKLDEFNPNQVFVKGKNKSKKTEKCTWSEWNSKWKFTKSDKRPNLEIQCTERQYYDLITADIEWAKQTYFKTKEPLMMVRMKMLGNQRKIWLANLKTKHVQKLLLKLKDKRVVVFANDIKQADTLSPNAVHSKNKGGQSIIDDFNSFKIDKVVSVKQINESLNLVEPEVGIIVQLASSQESGNKQVSVQNQQRLGRILRNSMPMLYVFVYGNTQDSTYLDKFKESINPDWFHNITIDKI